VIEAAAKADIRPVLCRQERVGVGIADGYARVKNGKTLSVFCMQYGPGAENAFPGVATAYSDSTPMLLLPLGHPRDRAQVFPLFSSARTYASVTKSVETINLAGQVADVMRRAISVMRMGRPGPAMVEIPADILNEEVPDALIEAYRPVKVTAAGANAREVEAAAHVLRGARRPVIHAGQGVLYAEATQDLLELADHLRRIGETLLVPRERPVPVLIVDIEPDRRLARGGLARLGRARRAARWPTDARDRPPTTKACWDRLLKKPKATRNLAAPNTDASQCRSPFVYSKKFLRAPFRGSPGCLHSSPGKIVIIDCQPGHGPARQENRCFRGPARIRRF